MNILETIQSKLISMYGNYPTIDVYLDNDYNYVCGAIVKINGKIKHTLNIDTNINAFVDASKFDISIDTTNNIINVVETY